MLICPRKLVLSIYGKAPSFSLNRSKLISFQNRKLYITAKEKGDFLDHYCLGPPTPLWLSMSRMNEVSKRTVPGRDGPQDKSSCYYLLNEWCSQRRMTHVCLNAKLTFSLFRMKEWKKRNEPKQPLTLFLMDQHVSHVKSSIKTAMTLNVCSDLIFFVEFVV